MFIPNKSKKWKKSLSFWKGLVKPMGKNEFCRGLPTV